MNRVLIVDDHEIIRNGLKALVNMELDMFVVDEAMDGAEAIHKVKEGEYDLVVMDINMPGKNGLDTLIEIKHLKPSMPVLTFSGSSEEEFALPLFRNGGSGFISKDIAPEQIISAMRLAIAGKKYVSENMKQILVQKFLNSGNVKLHDRLSHREYEVFLKIAKGFQLSVIANDMILSVKTIGTYRTRVLSKLKLNSNADLTVYGIDHDLVFKMN